MNVQILTAERIIESLRNGIPPEEKILELTVGREDEINRLRQILDENVSKALLLNANIGCGKTHLLKFIKQEALQKDYVTSLITLDSTSNVRFNRIDQIFGEVCRNIQIPENSGKSIRYLFDSLYDDFSDEDFIAELSNENRWDRTHLLKSPSLYIALRAWYFSYEGDHDEKIDDLVEDWFFNPSNYQNQRKLLYDNLVNSYFLRKKFRDLRQERQFYNYSEGIFNFRNQNYRQSWDALEDLNDIAIGAGYQGLIILVDEFEDIIHNLRNITYQQKAFENLFRFFAKDFPGIIFFAVTPDFVQKCKTLLLKKGIYEYDYSSFDDLEKFKMSPLSTAQILELSEKIMYYHELAYDYKIAPSTRNTIENLCNQSYKIALEDRVRQTIKYIIKILDSKLN